MFEVYRKEVMFGGRKLIFETGKIARQANGAVMVTYGGTSVLCTAVASKVKMMQIFSLNSQLSGKSICRRKIPGGFFKEKEANRERDFSM